MLSMESESMNLEMTRSPIFKAGPSDWNHAEAWTTNLERAYTAAALHPDIYLVEHRTGIDHPDPDCLQSRFHDFVG